MTMTGTECLLRGVLGRSVAVVVQVDVAEIAVRFREVPSGLILGTRSAVLYVSVAVRTDGDRSVVVEVESVVAAHP